MDIILNDILVMKKAHPCGEKRWQVLRTGADLRLKCMGCGHEVMTPRFKVEKNIRQTVGTGQQQQIYHKIQSHYKIQVYRHPLPPVQLSKAL